VVFLKHYAPEKHKEFQDKLIAGLKAQNLDSVPKRYAVVVRKGTVSIDVLLTREIQSSFDFLSMGPEFRWQMSCSTVVMQRNFIGGQPPEYRELVRVAKYWKKLKKTAIPKENLPSSYCVELLMLKAYQDRESDWTPVTTFVHFLKLFQKSQFISWNVYYQSKSILLNAENKHIVVVDPTNPTNNVADIKSWDPIVEYSRKTLFEFKECSEKETVTELKKELMEAKKELQEARKEIQESKKEIQTLTQLIYFNRVAALLSAKALQKSFTFYGFGWTVSLAVGNSWNSPSTVQLQITAVPPGFQEISFGFFNHHKFW